MPRWSVALLRLAATMALVVLLVGLTGIPASNATPTPELVPLARAATEPPPVVAQRGYPNASNTGVPAGVTLTPYTGPCTITRADTVIDARLVNCRLNIQARNVRITRSRIYGTVELRSASSGHSFIITDSEVHVGAALNTGIGRANFRAVRVEVTGGQRSIYCEYYCVVDHSWVHAQSGDPGGSTHFGGIRTLQNGTIRHNTITCEAQRGPGTGCSAGLSQYGDWAPVRNILIEDNIFYGGGGGGSTICAYGGSSPGKPYSSGARDIRFIDNVFVRGPSGHCGNVQTVLHFDVNAPGNVWSGNVWETGARLNPRF